MADVRLTRRGDALQAVTYDLLLTPAGQLDATGELETAVTIALQTDARAEPDDDLPDPRSDDRRGWWGDLDAEAIWDGWPIGSKLWLRARTTIRPAAARQGATTMQIRADILDALQPFVDRGIATRVDAEVARAGLEQIEARVVMFRGDTPILERRYADLWRGIAVAAPGA
ncbi:MAG: phage GP46 family protein [Methylorubrum rhodinum]|uniref:phage GP46 family protein n=1 Tax=Methylorubrum rhodinum TaxID=29428 RepID=UPI003BAED824